MTRWTLDLFCANFGHSLSNFAQCRQSWCAGCYSSNPLVNFPVAGLKEGVLPADDDRLVSGWEAEAKERNRFHQARSGDHLMLPFRCDLCCFRALQGRDPQEKCSKDVRLLICIRRVTLDAFWSRETTTVEAHSRKIRETIRLSAELGMAPPLHNPGPLQRSEETALHTAIVSVQGSLQKVSRYKGHCRRENMPRTTNNST